MVGIRHNKCPKEKEIYANWMKKSNDMKQNKDFNKLCYNICGSNQKIDNSDGYPKCVPCDKEKDNNNEQCKIDQNTKELTESAFQAQQDANPRHDFHKTRDWSLSKDLWCKSKKLSNDEILQMVGESEYPGAERTLPKGITTMDDLRKKINNNHQKIECKELCKAGGNRPEWACLNNEKYFGPNDIIGAEVLDWALEYYHKKKPENRYSNLNWHLFKGMKRNYEFESCMNDLLDTGMKNESQIIERIKGYTSILEWEEKDINYIERKLQKIISLRPENASECMQILNLKQNICRSGISEKMFTIFHLISSIFDITMNVDGIKENTREYRKMNFMIDRLGPYIPEVFQNIIDISKFHEMKTCKKYTANTLLLEKLYLELLVKPQNRKINWGIDIDFSYFKKMPVMEFIYTIVLMLVIGWFISKAIELVIAFTSRGSSN